MIVRNYCQNVTTHFRGLRTVHISAELHAQNQECGTSISYGAHNELDIAINNLEELIVSPPHKFYISLLKNINRQRTPHHVKRLHDHLAVQKNLPVFIFEHLVVTFVKCGALEDALRVFEQLPSRSAFSWTAIISGFVDQDRSRDALTMYRYMLEDGIEPDHYTFVSVLKACGNVLDLKHGKDIHAEVRSRGLESDVFIGTTLISMYGKCGSILEAENVFVALVTRNTVSWNAMLSAYVEQGYGEKALKLYQQMLQEGITPNSQTILISLQACCIIADNEEPTLDKQNKMVALFIGQCLHSYARKKSFTSDIFVGNTLVSLYGKCGNIAHVENVFINFNQTSVVSWTALMSSYVDMGEGEKALLSYKKMHEEGVCPNLQTLVCVLQACCILTEKEQGNIFEDQVIPLKIGHALHADALESFDSLDLFVNTTLLYLYAKCSVIHESENVFCRLPQRTIVQWNAMLSAYVEEGLGEKALLSYRQLLEEQTQPNQGTFVVALQACGILLDINETVNDAEGQLAKTKIHEIGVALHADVKRAGLVSDLYIGTTLVSMYGKCGTVQEAENIFHVLSLQNTISWNAMLSAYVDQEQGEKALQLYTEFIEKNVVLNDVTLVCLLQSCSATGCIELCKQFHFIIVCAGYDSRTFITSTLIDAYGSSASMLDAWFVLDGVVRPTEATWNAIISGYAGSGDYLGTLDMFHEMQLMDTKPSGTTFTSLLSACSHGGLVHSGIKYFLSIDMKYGLKQDMKHYVCAVDLFGRAGDLKNAEYIVQRIPDKSDLSLWLSFLGSCRSHGNIKLGKLAFDNVVSLHPTQATPYVLMSNIFSEAQQKYASGWLEL